MKNGQLNTEIFGQHLGVLHNCHENMQKVKNSWCKPGLAVVTLGSGSRVIY